MFSSSLVPKKVIEIRLSFLYLNRNSAGYFKKGKMKKKQDHI